jgi:CheY-like chemotaxis protein
VARIRLGEVAQEAADLTRADQSRADRALELELDLNDEGMVRADPTMLRELLVNLLLHARDRTPPGGRIRLFTGVKNQAVELSLRDGGKPYSQEELSRLFDPLRGKSKLPQLSLLLAVAKNQVERWGGSLLCENAADGEPGVLYRFHMPLAEEQEDEAGPAAGQASTVPSGTKRFQQTRQVLVVDDDLDNARMMAEVLTDEGYQVSVAHSGPEALKLWEVRRFDAALLDAMMPDLSGWELARELRSRTPDILLAVVTGGDVRGQNRANLALVDAVFRKPVDVGALDEFLSQSEAPRHLGTGAGESVQP